jgi:hypothetical protein
MFAFMRKRFVGSYGLDLSKTRVVLAERGPNGLRAIIGSQVVDVGLAQ